MKTNFDISIPSIPGKMIKFKIQDIKSVAFGSQKNRIYDNKECLTKKFIQSFNNFHEKQKQNQDSNHNEIDKQRNSLATQASFRYLIPEQKKYLLLNYQKHHKHQPLIQASVNPNKTYTFNKRNLQRNYQKKGQDKESQSSKNISLTDNQFFSVKESNDGVEEQDKKKYFLPTCVFKNETRKRFYSKYQKPINQLPGPGSYYNEKKKKRQPKKTFNIRNRTEEFDYKKLKKVINSVIQAPDTLQNIESDPLQTKQKEKLNHMFVIDDRDRFGNIKYDIASKVNVPGPGSYDHQNSIEEKGKKVLLVEQQRKLLKHWFNN